jgi:hypothetical protein
MRIQFSILMMLLLMKLTAFATVFDLRGFSNDKCYAHLVLAKKEKNQCSFALNPESTLKLNVSLESCPGSINFETGWFFARFRMKISADKPTTASWIDGFKVDSLTLEMMKVREEKGLPNPVGCN